MKIANKTLANGFSMPEFGMGTWQMGGRNEHDTLNDDAADIKAIQTAIELGITQIDTAESYADGYAEHLTGKAIQGYDRSRLFIISKVHAAHMHYDDLISSCRKSLERVGATYFDLYLLHRHNAEIPLQETMRAMDELMAEGMIRNIGVANFNVASLEEAKSCTAHPIVYNQVHYNLQSREPEHAGLLEYCQKNDILLGAWRPVEKGRLLNDIPKVLQRICEKYRKTPAQVAINWLVSQQNVVTLSKTRTIEHLIENLGGLGWQMKAEDIELLRKGYPDQKQISDIVPLG